MSIEWEEKTPSIVLWTSHRVCFDAGGAMQCGERRKTLTLGTGREGDGGDDGGEGELHFSFFLFETRNRSE